MSFAWRRHAIRMVQGVIFALVAAWISACISSVQDKEAVLDSVTRTHRLVIAHEAVEAFGVGAEIAATVADIGFYELDSPVVRVGAAFMPVPFARSLESEYLPDAKQIESAVRRTLELRRETLK